jgi:hypothetical protein
MSSSTQLAGNCPKCGGGAVVCRFNFFDRGDLQVHSWEHKCGNCGWRDTRAFRSDDPTLAANIDPAICPLCKRQGQIG